MDGLKADIAAFEARQAELEADHNGEWVIFYNQACEGFFPTMEQASSEAVKRFGRGPFLIRQIGAPPITLPASLMYHAAHANM